MSSCEVTYPGGRVEHFNPEASNAWIDRLLTVSLCHLAKFTASEPLEICAADSNSAVD